MVGEKTKELWKDPAYRAHMSAAHKWQKPPSRKGSSGNSGSFKKGQMTWLGKKFSTEHRRNISLGRRGRTAWNKGLGVLTSERKRARNSSQYGAWRSAVYMRDKHTCQKCKVRGGKLHPHHIEGFAFHPKLRFDTNNGITLCTTHHWEFHRIYGLRKGFDRAKLEKYLSSITT
jgi:hypothetical protein